MVAGRGWTCVLGLAALAVLLPGPAAGVVLDQCGIVSALRNQGFPEDQLPNWVCLIENESAGDTSVVGGPNTDGSYDYGLFQINDRYWCAHGSAGNGCNVSCEDLTTDDITAASTCAMQIYGVSGYQAWSGWVGHCQSPQDLPDISGC